MLIQVGGIISRTLFVFTIPVWILVIIIAGIMALPFWIVTGRAIYGTKTIQGFNTWHHKLYSKGNTR